MSLGPDQGRSIFSAFAQDIFAPNDKISLTGSLRFDHFSDLGGTVSPRAAAVFTLPREVHFKLIYGRAFRAPTFAELDYRIPVLDGNPELDSVRADTIEAAVSVRRRAFRVAASGYATWLRDVIAPAGAFDPRRSRPAENAPGSDLRGFELEMRRSIGTGNSIFVNYAFQQAEFQDSARKLPGVPAQLGNLGATFALGDHVWVTPLLSFRSSRPRAEGDSRPRTPGYGLFGLTIRGLKLYRTLSATVSAQNLFGKNYADPTIAGGVPGDYPRAGRRLLVSASYEF
jgi:iron complex outermembrane receptor protein